MSETINTTDPGSKDFFFKEFIDIEKKINNILKGQINDNPNKLEEYFFCYFIILTAMKSTKIYSHKTYLRYYNVQSLRNYNYENNIDKTYEQSIENKIKRKERFIDYRTYFNQAMGSSAGNTNNIAMFYGFASNSIYNSKKYMVDIAAVYPKIVDVVSIDIDAQEKRLRKAFSPSLLDSIKSIFNK